MREAIYPSNLIEKRPFGAFFYKVRNEYTCSVNRSESVTNLQGGMEAYRLVQVPQSLLRAFEGL